MRRPLVAAFRRPEYADLLCVTTDVPKGIEPMRYRHLLVCTAVFTAALFSARPSSAQGELRFGVWDNSTNPNNVMTYEAYEKDRKSVV